jgi:hypothetical protein
VRHVARADEEELQRQTNVDEQVADWPIPIQQPKEKKTFKKFVTIIFIAAYKECNARASFVSINS